MHPMHNTPPIYESYYNYAVEEIGCTRVRIFLGLTASPTSIFSSFNLFLLLFF